MYVQSLVGSVRFENGTYNVSESSTAQIVLILSKPSSNEITVEVLHTGITATGETYTISVTDSYHWCKADLCIAVL